MKTKNLTKKQLQALRIIRNELRRGVDYLRNEKVVGIATEIKTTFANGADYLIKNPACIETSANTVGAVRVMNKNFGSDIVGLYNALTGLDEFLTEIREA